MGSEMCIRDRLYNQPSAALPLKVRMVKAEAVEALLYGCVTRTVHSAHHTLLRSVHHALLRRCLGWHKRNRTDRVPSYRETLAKTGCESVETTVRKRTLHFAGFVTHISSRRIPNTFGELIAGKGQERQFNGRHNTRTSSAVCPKT